MTSIIPKFKYPVPVIEHDKLAPYIDFPLVFNETVTNRVFYVDGTFLIAMSSLAATTLSKWEGNGWTPVLSITNPDTIAGRGFFSITTTSNQRVTITEYRANDAAAVE